MSLRTAYPSPSPYAGIAAWIAEVGKSRTEAPVAPELLSETHATPLTDTADASSTRCPSPSEGKGGCQVVYEVALSDGGSSDDRVPWATEAPPARLTFGVSDTRHSLPDTDPVAERVRAALYLGCQEQSVLVVDDDVHTLYVKVSAGGDHVRDTADAWKKYTFVKTEIKKGAVDERSGFVNSGSDELTQYSSNDENDVPEIDPEQVSAAEILVSFRAGNRNSVGSGADESTQYSSNDENDVPEIDLEQVSAAEILVSFRAGNRNSVGSGADESTQYSSGGESNVPEIIEITPEQAEAADGLLSLCTAHNTLGKGDQGDNSEEAEEQSDYTSDGSEEVRSASHDYNSDDSDVQSQATTEGDEESNVDSDSEDGIQNQPYFSDDDHLPLLAPTRGRTLRRMWSATSLALC